MYNIQLQNKVSHLERELEEARKQLAQATHDPVTFSA